MRYNNYRPSYRRSRRPYSRRSAYSTRSRKNYNAAQQSKAMVVTQSRTTNSANRVGANGLNRISVGRFKDLPTLWPDKFLCKMKYQDTVNTTMAIGSSGFITQTSYRINSLYDPLITTAAEQPIPGFQELASMYASYRVHGAKITANVSPSSATAQTPTLVVAGFSRSLSGLAPSSTYGQLLNSTANPFVVWGMVTPNSPPLNLETYVGMKKLAGSVVADTDDDYASAINNNPAVPLYGYVALGVPVAPSSNATYTTIIEIEFWAEFYGRDFEYN